jgi:hypothetical protein
MVVYSCNPSTGEAEAGEQEFKANLGYIARPCFKINEKKKKTYSKQNK